MRFRSIVGYISLVGFVAASRLDNEEESAKGCPCRSSSSSSSCVRHDCRMINPGAACTTCACQRPDRGNHPLTLPLIPYPNSECVVPLDFFKDKRVLVIGATSGFGLKTAEQFQQFGAHVVGTSRNPKKAPKLPWPLIKVNIAYEKQVDDLIKDYLKAYGCPPDILIDNGSNACFGVTMNMSNEEILYTIKATGSGHIRLIKGFIEKLPSKHSNFISLSTTTSLTYASLPQTEMYIAGKEMLRQFIQNWGMELGFTYPNVFLGFLAPSPGNTKFLQNGIIVDPKNPLTAQYVKSLTALLAASMDPIWVGKSYLQFAFMAMQKQTCDIGYVVVNGASKEAFERDFAYSSFLANSWSNSYPVDYIKAISPLLQPFGGPVYNYTTSYTRCLV